jgi:hypothetical protein
MTPAEYRKLTKASLRIRARAGVINRDVQNKGGQGARKGTEVKITSKGGGLEIEIPTCRFCGQFTHIRHIDADAVDLLPDEPERGTLFVNGSNLGPAERDPVTGNIEAGPHVTARAKADR